ncbi:protein-L-isoaspartate O-methyltransferase [Aphanomyces invadans]|uniref:protein-L-isoaspartate(D-aspartate) O-methyltransferase n=1 Tax=Aphanomyces invadans TaxID=157072 RepID=A0A024TVP4_9STRA|nr:protein-L-isoaspartate O-methyltransferase [Aphanomyces invadans]ETV98235.1 protein-L-isoaspartate O-methyltransferase [Aphanomyces invadans]|eukprot:XP_008873110.1 protein-L-isoaspartate O-methyltransferase [Aphanomyces invadans]
MAWQCSAASHRGLVDNLVQAGLFQSSKAVAAMMQTDRGNYCPMYPYTDAPQPIGWGQTISAPHIHAGALEQASQHLRDGSRVLDVGCGSGYLSACFARLVAPTGKVVGIDNVHELVELAEANARRGDWDLLDKGILSFRRGDGWLGAPNDGPFDWIYVGAAAPQVPPALLAQLADKGSLLIPVGIPGDAQTLVQITRDGLHFHKTHLAIVQFVPLVHSTGP